MFDLYPDNRSERLTALSLPLFFKTGDVACLSIGFTIRRHSHDKRRTRWSAIWLSVQRTLVTVYGIRTD